MDAVALSKIASKVKRTARARDVLELVEAVEKHVAEGCAECRRRREETAARVSRHRKKKAKGA
jgi:hypothetical protein